MNVHMRKGSDYLMFIKTYKGLSAWHKLYKSTKYSFLVCILCKAL